MGGSSTWTWPRTTTISIMLKFASAKINWTCCYRPTIQIFQSSAHNADPVWCRINILERHQTLHVRRRAFSNTRTLFIHTPWRAHRSPASRKAASSSFTYWPTREWPRLHWASQIRWKAAILRCMMGISGLSHRLTWTARIRTFCNSLSTRAK